MGAAVSDEEDVNRESGFNEITKEYQASPTIENYVRLRRKYPLVPLEIATSGGLEFFFLHEDELRLHGIDPYLVVGAMDADLAAQAELSLVLLELIIERQKKEKEGETHIVRCGNAISDALINYLIGTCLDALDWNHEMEISRELIVLLKHQIGVVGSDYDSQLKKREQRQRAIWIAAQIVARGGVPSYRKIGRIMDVEASTVKRWFPNGEMISEAKALLDQVADLNPSLLAKFKGVASD